MEVPDFLQVLTFGGFRRFEGFDLLKVSDFWKVLLLKVSAFKGSDFLKVLSLKVLTYAVLPFDGFKVVIELKVLIFNE